MAELTSLPAETIRHIFSYAGQEVQKALRLTSRRLGAIGQHSVFQTLSVWPTEESYGRLESILRRADLPPDSQYGDGEDVASRLFSYLKEMPQLKSAAVRFHWECPEEYCDVQQDESFRSEVMQEGLKALAAIPGLKELAVRDMYNVNETDPETVANRNKILSRLRSLRLNITNVNRGMDGSSDYDVYLAFGNHTFIHDSQLDWILSHAATLTALYLDDCAIVHEAALVNLRDFRYGHAPDWWEDETTPFESEQKIRIGFGEESYLAFDCGTLPSEYTAHLYWEIPKEGDDLDYVGGEKLEASEDVKKALEELWAKLGLSWSISSWEDE
ncbi:hypothetical protein BDW72DRAFT_208988 [Aspergillus terricola var. indicus]